MNPLSRRSFFQGAALAASATRVMGANDRVQVGIVGLGGRGADHLRTYLAIPGAQLTGLCDVNQAALEKSNAAITREKQPKAKEFKDMREMYASKDIDAVSIATPNHWHALAMIRAAEAGKDVYCEKPASHNIYEGYRMVEVARKTGRLVQIGSQSRSTGHNIKAMQLLRDGIIGKLYLAKGLCFKRRKSIGRTPEEPVPAGIDWDQFLGPAPKRPFTWNRFRYNWHWFWDTGNGDIGNQGVHEMDICLWGLGKTSLPKSVYSTGGKFLYDDDQETPNTQIATYDFGDVEMQFEVRGLLTGPESYLLRRGTNTVGNIFFGADGYLTIDSNGFQVFKGEGSEKIMDQGPMPVGYDTKAHMENFLNACRSRKHADLNADIEIGARAAALCHMANISYRVGRKLNWDDAKRKFNDAEADKLITRDYRKPYVV